MFMRAVARVPVGAGRRGLRASRQRGVRDRPFDAVEVHPSDMISAIITYELGYSYI